MWNSGPDEIFRNNIIAPAFRKEELFQLCIMLRNTIKVRHWGLSVLWHFNLSVLCLGSTWSCHLCNGSCNNFPVEFFFPSRKKSSCALYFYKLRWSPWPSDPFAEDKGLETADQAVLLCLHHPPGNLGDKASCKRAVNFLMLSYSNH